MKQHTALLTYDSSATGTATDLTNCTGPYDGFCKYTFSSSARKLSFTTIGLFDISDGDDSEEDSMSV
jgi:hypothetical protein